MKAWVTKYALTEGIQEVSATWDKDISEWMISYKRPDAMMTEYAHRKDWHRTPGAALLRAEEMRKTKIASIKKQLARLEIMKFKLP